MKSYAIAAAAMTAFLAINIGQANALTMKECSAKYKAAQTAGTLSGVKWNDFRKAQCGSDASAAATTTGATDPSTAAAKPAAPKTAATPAPATIGNAVFPSSVSSKYASESAGRARMHTCLDQYNANKTSNANGGLKWIQKGGGYYSECSKQLKS
jgi:hypothetical protein